MDNFGFIEEEIGFKADASAKSATEDLGFKAQEEAPIVAKPELVLEDDLNKEKEILRQQQDARIAAIRKEQSFQSFYKQIAQTNKLDPNPDAPVNAYDFRSLFDAVSSGQIPVPAISPDKKKFKLPDDFVKPGHPDFFIKTDPQIWTVEQTERYIKDHPAQTPEQEAQLSAFLNIKKQNMERFKNSLTGYDRWQMDQNNKAIASGIEYPHEELLKDPEKMTAFESFAVPYVKGAAGFFTRPFGVEPFGSTFTPEEVQQSAKDHPVASAVGKAMGGLTPVAAAITLAPNTLLGQLFAFATTGAVQQAGVEKTQASLMDQKGSKERIVKTTLKSAAYAPLWFYTQGLTLGGPVASIFARAGARGTGAAGIEKAGGATTQEAVMSGLMTGALSGLFELTPYAVYKINSSVRNKSLDSMAETLVKNDDDIRNAIIENYTKKYGAFPSEEELTKLIRAGLTIEAAKNNIPTIQIVSAADKLKKTFEPKTPEVMPGGESGQVFLPFSEGDIVRFGGVIGKISKIAGDNAIIVSTLGKMFVKPLNKIQDTGLLPQEIPDSQLKKVPELKKDYVRDLFRIENPNVVEDFIHNDPDYARAIARNKDLGSKTFIESDDPEQWPDFYKPYLDSAIKPDVPGATGQPEVIIWMGLPGSGKTQMFKAMGLDKTHIQIDPDDAKFFVPETSQDPSLADYVHKESAYMADELLLEKALEQKKNIIWPLVGKNPGKVKELIQQFRDAGYKVELNYNRLSTIESMKRTYKRYLEDKRLVSTEYIQGIGEDTLDKNYKSLKPLADKFASWDVNKKFGEAPEALDKGENNAEVIAGKVQAQGAGSGRSEAGLRAEGAIEGQGQKAQEVTGSQESYLETFKDKEVPRKKLSRMGFDEEAAGFGDEAIVLYKDKDPIVAYHWSDDGLDGFAVHPKYQGQGIAKKVLTEFMGDSWLKVMAPNRDLLRILKKIGEVDYNRSTQIAVVTPFGSPKEPWQMTQKEFEDIPIIKYIEDSLKDKASPMKVSERDQLANQLVDQGLMSIDDFNAMTGRHGFGKKVVGVSNLSTGKPIPSKPVDDPQMGDLLNYIGQWQTFRNIPLFAHRKAIIQALVEGKSVPKKVIDSYKGWGWIEADGTTFDPAKGGAITLKAAVESHGVKFDPGLIIDQPIAGGLPAKMPEQVSKWLEKGVTIVERQAPIRITDPEAKIKDMSGNMVDLPTGHEMTPYKLSNGKIWLHDGKNVVIDSGQLQNLKNRNLVLGEKKFFTPEEQDVEEVVKGISSQERQNWERLQKLTNFGTSSNQKLNEQYLAINRKIDTKFSQYQLPGGENYKEVLIKAPDTKPYKSISVNWYERVPGEHRAEVDGRKFMIIPEGDHYYVGEENAILGKPVSSIEQGKQVVQDTLNSKEIEKAQSGRFRSSHWDEPNVLAHIRMNDRTTPDGKKVLFVEEIQSDWAREARRKTVQKYRDDPVVEHPLLKNWQTLALKNILKKAIDGGYDGIAWTTGEQQADRYDLSKQVNYVDYSPIEHIDENDQVVPSLTKYNVLVAPKGDADYIHKVYTRKELEDFIGKDVVKKMDEDIGESQKLRDPESGVYVDGKRLRSNDIKIGGEWAKNLYDKQIPNILKDLTKGEVGSVNVSGTLKGFPTYTKDRVTSQPALILTPQIKARIMGDQPMAGGLPAEVPSSKEITKLSAFEGVAYRGDTGYKNEGTALDVVNYEEQDLGNIDQFKHLTPGMREELAQYSAGDIIWVTKDKTVAEGYGSASVVEDLGKNPRIIAEDGDGGYLVLKDKGISEDKDGRNLLEWENGDLTLAELKKKLEIAIEGNEDPEFLQMMRDEIDRREVSAMFNKEFPGGEITIEEAPGVIETEYNAMTPEDKARFELEMDDLRKTPEGNLFIAIKALGGIKPHEKGFLKEEEAEIPFYLKNKKSKSTLDQLVTELESYGWRFESEDDLRAAIKEQAANPVAKVDRASLRKVIREAEKNRKLEQKILDKVLPGKRRKFITTVKEAEKTAPEVAQKVESRYEPIKNAETLKQAQDFVEANYNEAVELVEGPGRTNTLTNAIGIVLIDKAQAEGRWSDAIRLVERLAEKNTELGQAIQALSMYERLSPEGILQYAEKQVRRAREDIKQKERLTNYEKIAKTLNTQADKDKLADKLGIPHISELVAEEMRKMAERIQTMPPGRDKSIEEALLLKKISDQIPVGLGKKLSMIQTLAQLLNPKTFVRNVLGNVGFQIAENISDTLGTLLDIGVSLRTGKRTVYLPDYVAQAKGLAQGMKEGTEEALKGVSLKQTQSKYSLPKNGVFDKGVMGALEKVLRISLSATDRAFYQAAFNQSIRAQVAAAGVDEPTEEMIEKAHLLGLYRTFQDDNVISDFFVRLKRLLNLQKDFGLGDIVIKYPKTPANILSRGIEYSPFGFIKTAFAIGRPLLKQGPFDQEEFVRSTSRAFTGTALMVGIGAILAGMGIISGKRSKDRDVAATREGVGIREYQINTSALKRFLMSGLDPDQAKMQEDDVLTTYDWFLPASIDIALGADLVLRPKENVVNKVLNLGDRVLQASETLQEQPLVRGLKVLTSRQNLAEGISETIQDIPASFVPTLLNQIRQLTDNTARNTKDPDYFTEIYKKMAVRVPFLASTLPERVDVFGKPKEMYQLGSNNPFNVFLNPAFVNKYKPDPISKMVLDIWENTGETIQFPRVAQAKIKMSGFPEPVELSPRQYMEFQKYIGLKTNILFRILGVNKKFMSKTDEEKAKILQGYLTDINTAAKVELLGYRPKHVSHDVITIIKSIGRRWREIQSNTEKEEDLGFREEEDLGFKPE